MEVSNQARQFVRFEGIGNGEEIASNTMIKMRNIINSSIRNYYVRRWAEIITDSLIDSDYEKVKAVYDFLATRTRYLKDPFGLELLKTPPVSLQLIEAGDRPALDCDDLTILSLSLLKSIGFPVALRAVSYHLDKRFRHIYGLVKVKNEWIPFDLVKLPGLGREHPGVTRIVDMEV